MSFITIALIALVFIILYQISKASEYASVLRGEEKVKAQTNRLMAWLLLAFFILGLWGIYKCHVALIDKLGPESASVQGANYDVMFNVTLLVTGIVFFATQALLFWFAFRYQASETRTAFYYPHNNKLELIWTTIPAIVMAILVAIGLRNWYGITSDAPSNAQVVEVVGKQFNWIIRYPGPDGRLGKRDFRSIDDGNNILGMNWKDRDNLDDVISQSGELHLIKGMPVKLIIGSRDVIHDVGLPHFRFKMDAVPGITTSIWFTPRYTTEEMRTMTNNPNFTYEIACDQMCGKGHYSMRGTIIVHKNQQEFNQWLSGQKSYYATNFGGETGGTPGGTPGATPGGPAADSTGKTTNPAIKSDSTHAVTMK